MRQNLVLAVLSFVLLSVFAFYVQIWRKPRGKNDREKLEPPDGTLI